MDKGRESEAIYFIDKTPAYEKKSNLKRQLIQTDKPSIFQSKKRKQYHFDHERKSLNKVSDDSGIEKTIIYFKNILNELIKGVDPLMKENIVSNILQESIGKEVELSCHNSASHCLEILLDGCKNKLFLMQFMQAFEKDKIAVCTNATASHITELLIQHAVKALPNWCTVLDLDESEDKTFVSYCIDWLHSFGNFALENLDNCLQSPYSCHVLCTLIEALAGNLGGNKELASKNLRKHKKEFQSQFNEVSSPKLNNEEIIVLEQIPSMFSAILRSIYKSLIELEYLTDYISESFSATVIQALLFALKKRHPKSCKKMVKKVAKKICLERNQDNVPICLFHKNASFVFDEMFKVADEDLQVYLWSEYIDNCLENLVTDSVGNYVIQRVYDAIKSKTLFETVCKKTWDLFDAIAECQNFGIFVSMASACNRLNAQQASFMENIMKCLQCFQPIERQDLIIPLLLGFQKYDSFMTHLRAKAELKVCLQGSLVIQAILKFQKPLKAVKSLHSMPPEEIEFLAGHNQGCHVLNAFFGSITVGDKNKEKMLYHLQPILLSMACDRNKGLTLARIWTVLSLKLKEIVARQLSEKQQALKNTKSGYAIFQKFGISRFKKLQEWRQMQSNIFSFKNSQKHLP